MTRTVAVGIQSRLHTDALQGVEARASVEELLAPGSPSLMSAIGTKRTRSSPKPMTAHRLKADLEAAAKRAQRVCDAPLIDYVQLSEIGGGSSHQRTCLRWEISLLSGKIQGISAHSAPKTVQGSVFRTINQCVKAKFPTQKNREFFRENSEFPLRIRECRMSMRGVVTHQVRLNGICRTTANIDAREFRNLASPSLTVTTPDGARFWD